MSNLWGCSFQDFMGKKELENKNIVAPKLKSCIKWSFFSIFFSIFLKNWKKYFFFFDFFKAKKHFQLCLIPLNTSLLDLSITTLPVSTSCLPLYSSEKSHHEVHIVCQFWIWSSIDDWLQPECKKSIMSQDHKNNHQRFPYDIH